MLEGEGKGQYKVEFWSLVRLRRKERGEGRRSVLLIMIRGQELKVGPNSADYRSFRLFPSNRVCVLHHPGNLSVKFSVDSFTQLSNKTHDLVT